MRQANRGVFFIITALLLSAMIFSAVSYAQVIGRHSLSQDPVPIGYDLAVNRETRNVLTGATANVSKGGPANQLETNIKKWVELVQNRTQYGMFTLDYTLLENTSFVKGVRITKGDGFGVSSAYANFTYRIKALGTNLITKFAQSVQTALKTTIIVPPANGAVTLNAQLSNDGNYAITDNFNSTYKKKTGPERLATTTKTDYGNGTYKLLVTGLPKAKLTLYVKTTDLRGINVQANNTLQGVYYSFIAYNSQSGNNKAPKERTWNGTSQQWSTESAMPTSGAIIDGVRVAYNPLASKAYEKIVVTLGNNRNLDAYVWNGNQWLVTNDIGTLNLNLAANNTRPYDIAYEKTSGRAVLIWASPTLLPTQDLGYRIWNGTAWSDAQYLDDTDLGLQNVGWVRLAQKPTAASNELALIYQDTLGSSVKVWIWDPSTNSWGNKHTLVSGGYTASGEAMALEYEQATGNLMAVAQDGDKIRWNKWTGSWGTSATVDPDPARTDIAQWLSLKADKATNSNKIFLVLVDDASHLITLYWNGSSWTVHSEHDSAIDAKNQRPADFAWEPTSSKGLLVWGTSAGKLTYKTFQPPDVFSAPLNITASGTHFWVQLVGNNGGARSDDIAILGAFVNQNLNLGALTWNSATQTLTNLGDTHFATDVKSRKFETFELEFKKDDD